MPSKEMPKRHPRHCKYWANTPEGCRRNEACQYLHVTTKRFYNNDKHQRLSTVLEDDNEDVSVTCDQCDCVYNDKGKMTEHTKSLHEEMAYSCHPCQYRSKPKERNRTHRGKTDFGKEEEENYFVTTTVTVSIIFFFMATKCSKISKRFEE